MEDKVILITGGAAGIGAALARKYLAENARFVAFFDISEKEGNALEAELKAKFGALRAKFTKCDIANEQDFSFALMKVIDKYRRLDVVVNNAAVVAKDKNLNRRMIEVNFTATVNSTLRAIDIMHANGNGTIVNISSLQALTSSCSFPVYSATKTAVIEFSRSLAREIHAEKKNIRIITVCLGPTDTGILHRYNSNNDDNSEEKISTFNEKQRVASAASGLVEIIKGASNGETWVIVNDKPPVNITENIDKSQQYLKESVQ